MGEFFNKMVKGMPNAEAKRRMKSTKVTINPVFGQTKGYLEEMRKEFSVSSSVDERYQQRVEQMAKAREAKRVKNE